MKYIRIRINKNKMYEKYSDSYSVKLSELPLFNILLAIVVNRQHSYRILLCVPVAKR